MRNEALRRQWYILHRVYNYRNRGISRKQLAEEFSVSQKTITRDIENLSTCDFPIYEQANPEDENRLYYYMTDTYRMPQMQFSMVENYALYALMKISSPLRGYFDKALEDCFDKIYAQASPEFTSFAKKFSSLILPDLSSAIEVGQDTHTVFLRIIESILQNRKIQIRYSSVYSRKVKEHTLSPLSIKFHKNNFYLAAYLKRKDQVLIFALNRIMEIEILDEQQDPVRFDPEAFFEESFGLTQGETFKVKLKFDATVSQFVQERVFHPKATMKQQSDGSVILQMPAQSMHEVTSLVLSYMDHVEVLEPRELVDEVRKVIECIRSSYSQDE